MSHIEISAVMFCFTGAMVSAFLLNHLFKKREIEISKQTEQAILFFVARLIGGGDFDDLRPC
jgi:hypothetical protein